MSELKPFPKHPHEIYPPQFNSNSDHWRAALQDYERARADYWESRARLAVEALNCLYPAACFDLRWSEDDEARKAYQSRVDTIEDALRSIGPLPKEQT